MIMKHPIFKKLSKKAKLEVLFMEQELRRLKREREKIGRRLAKYGLEENPNICAIRK